MTHKIAGPNHIFPELRNPAEEAGFFIQAGFAWVAGFLNQMRRFSTSSSNLSRRGCTTLGHPTVGTAWLIRDQIIRDGVEKVVLNLKVGQIPVTFEDDVLWMKQIQPKFMQTCTPAQVAPVLNLNESDFDTRFPIQEVSTGLEFLIVPLKGMDAVRRARTNLDRLKQLIAPLQAKMIFLFSAETYEPENQINARMFGDEFGVVEDPATGSANGCLAGYLVKYHYLGTSEIDVRVEQGYEIKRPSILRLRAGEREGKIEVNVGGKVFLVARGELV